MRSLYKTAQGVTEDPLGRLIQSIVPDPFRSLLLQMLGTTEITVGGQDVEVPRWDISSDLINRAMETVTGKRVEDVLGPAGSVRSRLHEDLAYRIAHHRGGMSEKDARDISQQRFSWPGIMAMLYMHATGAGESLATMENHFRQRGMMARDTLKRNMVSMTGMYQAVAEESFDPENRKKYYGMTPGMITEGYLMAYDRGEFRDLLERLSPETDIDTLRNEMADRVHEDFQFYALMRGTGLMDGSPSEIMGGLSTMFGGDPFALFGREGTMDMFRDLAATGFATGMNLKEIGEVLELGVEYGARNLPDAIARGKMYILSERGRQETGDSPFRRAYGEHFQKAMTANWPNLTFVAGAYGMATEHLGFSDQEARNRIRESIRRSGGDHRNLIANLSRQFGVPRNSILMAGSRTDWRARLAGGDLTDLAMETLTEIGASKAGRLFQDPDIGQLARTGALSRERIHRHYDDLMNRGVPVRQVERLRARSMDTYNRLKSENRLFEIMTPAGTPEFRRDLIGARREGREAFQDILTADPEKHLIDMSFDTIAGNMLPDKTEKPR